MSNGIISWLAWLIGSGSVNDHDAGSLVVDGWGEWYGSEFVALDGFYRREDFLPYDEENMHRIAPGERQVSQYLMSHRAENFFIHKK